MFEYVKVTRSDGENLDCVGLLTQKTYKGVEIVENYGIDCPPEVDEVGILFVMQNAEYAWVGNLQQFLSNLVPNEMRLHSKRETGMYFKGGATVLADQEIELYRGTVTKTGTNPTESYTYTYEQVVKFTKEGDILIERRDVDTEDVLASIHINADNTIDITGTTINLN